MRFTFLLLAGLLAWAPRAPAQPLPELGDAAGAAISPQVERRIGESIVREIRYRDPAYVDDAEITDFLANLGRRLLSAIPEARHEFEFFAVRDPAINAFALPGGFVGVHTGLLTAAAIGLLTIYDMLKAADRGMTLTDLRLEHKRGGKSGVFLRMSE